MSADLREKIINSALISFSDSVEPSILDAIRDKMAIVLGKYDITERSVSLTVYDDDNERLLKRYIGCLRIDGKSEKTIYQYARTCRKLAESSGKKFTEMGVYDIRMFLALEKERGVSSRSVENTRANLSAFFQWLSLEEEIQKNPCLKIKPIKYQKEIKLPFSDIEIDAMRSACGSLKERALIEFLLASGVRVSELSSMDVSDVDFHTLTVHVKHGKGAKERITYLTPVARKHLSSYLEARKEGSSCLFCNKNHGRLCSTGIQYILKQIEKRSGVTNVHPHRFRRTFASGLAARGMDIQEIRILLGHSDLNTTLEYVHTDNAQIKTSYSKYCI